MEYSKTGNSNTEELWNKQIGGAHEVGRTCLHREADREAIQDGRVTYYKQIGGAHEVVGPAKGFYEDN